MVLDFFQKHGTKVYRKMGSNPVFIALKYKFRHHETFNLRKITLQKLMLNNIFFIFVVSLKDDVD